MIKTLTKMTVTIAEASSMTITPEMFDPPLKRTEAAIPGYWTVKELAAELEVSTRYVHYLIKGDPKNNIRIQLEAYRDDNILLVPEQSALQHLWNIRQKKKRNKT